MDSLQHILISNLLKVQIHEFRIILDLKGKDEQKVDEVLNAFIKIFAYLSSKDGFLKIYGKLLSKRLINGQSLDFNAEKDMIKKLSVKDNYFCNIRLNVVEVL